MVKSLTPTFYSPTRGLFSPSNAGNRVPIPLHLDRASISSVNVPTDARHVTREFTVADLGIQLRGQQHDLLRGRPACRTLLPFPMVRA